MIKDRLMPFIPGSGFRMAGMHVWCGSCIRDEGGRYHLFASCWPFETRFPDGYMNHSRIVQAVTDDLDKPFAYVRDITSPRSSLFWDGAMQHNPYIVKIGNAYVLYYIGTPDGSAGQRAIGYAVADALTGDFVRSEGPLCLPPNANNPAVWVEKNGRLVMAYRDGALALKIATAQKYDGEYTLCCDDAFPGICLEDPFLWQDATGTYHIVLEDNVGGLTGHVRFGAHIVSDDLTHWTLAGDGYVYDHILRYADGASQQLLRRERPFFLIENGKLTALFSGAIAGGAAWNCVQRLQPC